MKNPVVAEIDAVDRVFMLAMARHRHRPLTAPLRTVSYSGNGIVWVVAGAVLTTLNIKHIEVIPMQVVVARSMFCSLVAWGVGAVIKSHVARRRPAQTIEGFRALVKSPKDDSFPSSHSSAAFAFFTAMSISHHPWAPYAGIWAAFVAFSRFYLGVHYLSDVLGGVVLGALSGLAVGFVW